MTTKESKGMLVDETFFSDPINLLTTKSCLLQHILSGLYPPLPVSPYSPRLPSLNQSLSPIVRPPPPKFIRDCSLRHLPPLLFSLLSLSIPGLFCSVSPFKTINRAPILTHSPPLPPPLSFHFDWFNRADIALAPAPAPAPPPSPPPFPSSRYRSTTTIGEGSRVFPER